MSYSTPTTTAQATLEIKKSEFISYGFPVLNREQIMFHVEQLRTQYPDARHICYGYIVGDPNNTTSAGFDDDGEPLGTAGKPILNVLQHKSIGNCLIAVVRYFGGIKLGAGGLTRAYGSIAQAVVEKMILREFVPLTQVMIYTDFANESFIRHVLDGFQAIILNVGYAKDVVLIVELAEQSVNDLTEKIGFYGTVTVIK